MLDLTQKCFVNSSALSLWQYIFRTRLASMSTSRFIWIMHLNGFEPLMPEDRYLNFFKALPDLSHSHNAIATVPRIFNKTYIFGHESISQTFATEPSWFSFGIAFHRLSHLEYSSKESPGDGSLSLYFWILLSSYFHRSYYFLPLSPFQSLMEQKHLSYRSLSHMPQI